MPNKRFKWLGWDRNLNYDNSDDRLNAGTIKRFNQIGFIPLKHHTKKVTPQGLIESLTAVFKNK